ncbi:hypothetical protein CBS101457_002371 [Exobasidium rhododendri]|nr:hypothetical protein CBS101457_002371 [Exobasidium rhododendri]
MVDPSRLVEIHPERVGAVASPHFPHNDTSSTNFSWSLDRFRDSLRTHITRLSPDRIEFDLIGLDASIANAIRRTLMAEVPTVAIEEVYVNNNTSIVVDEVLSHRLGLVPMKIDPGRVEMRKEKGVATDRDTIVFSLNVCCERIGKSENQIINSKVLSGDFDWVPQGDQANFWSDDPPRPVHNNILLAKLRPGQGINMELHCAKGVGKDHAKFSPVSTASYRLLPHIDIPDPLAIEEKDIPKFVQCFPKGVIGVRRHKSTGQEEVYVKNARKDTVSREVLRHAEFEGKVKLGRVRDHFLFDVESTGAISPEALMPSAIAVLLEKIRVVRKGVEQLESQHAYYTQPR